ncbi:MAG TPA: hypothetical protein VNF99_07795 [Stellaceae bacterium]|nr:hypothetical protein [Stellaceae bacterium]
MIAPDRKRRLVKRLRELAQATHPAPEWPGIAANYRRVADDIEAELTAAEVPPPQPL